MTPRTIPVDPVRLAYGAWCHQRNRQIGQGDINASYSADRIGMSQPIRKPFRFEGGYWVSVGGTSIENDAYRLVLPTCFKGETFTYNDRESAEARAESKGFYHGMIVKWRGQEMILVGPPVSFVADEAKRAPTQMSLF